MKAEDKFKGNPNAIFLDITVADQTQRVGLLGGQYIINDPRRSMLADLISILVMVLYVMNFHLLFS